METFDIANMTARQLDYFAYNKDCVIGRLEPSDGKVRGILPERLQGGWVARWVGTTTKKDRGVLIILPGDERTRDIVYHATVRKVKALGLSHEIAKQIAKSKVRFKYEIMDAIVDCFKMNNQVTYDALLFLATGIVAYENWISMWRSVLPESTKGFDEPRMVSLATAITAINKKISELEKNEQTTTTSVGK